MEWSVRRAVNPVLRALLATAAVVTIALCWFGWRMWTQERAVDRERQRERIEGSSEAMAAVVRGKWAQAGEALSRWVSDDRADPPLIPGTVILATAGNRVEVSPRNGLPFVPWLPGEPDLASVFAEGEAAEFGGGGAARAAAVYRGIAGHPNASLRAEALLRLARVLLQSGERKGALRAYESLARMEGTLAAGLPAGLVGLDGQRKLGSSGSGEQIAAGLASGRWLLRKGPAEYYREAASLRSTPGDWAAAEAMSLLWEKRGGPVIEIDGKPWLGMWRGNEKRWAGLVAMPARFLEIRAPAGVRFQLTDARGRLLAGTPDKPQLGTAQVLGEVESPWVLRVWQDGGGTAYRTMTPALVGLVILLLWGAVYFMARAIRRESEVARLQSDFVAAVSHEFRSPLTTVRQLSEMLEMGQVPSEERRQKYYSVLAGEAHRLQRLVEGLLHLGRMEAGAQSYRMQQLKVGDLVRQAVEEAGQGGGRVAVSESGEVHANGDREALSAAIRNLLDNALKYTPADSCVEAGWRQGGRQVLIFVRDHGPGIPVEEQKAVFEKFVRGRRAVKESIQGTGVGLAMVKHIMKAHGGEVRLESAPGQGCTFTLVLPESE